MKELHIELVGLVDEKQAKSIKAGFCRCSDVELSCPKCEMKAALDGLEGK